MDRNRKVNSTEAEKHFKAVGVKQVAILAVGKFSVARQAKEHTQVFRRGYRWRACIEGRIASLRRDYSWRKIHYHRQDGMECGWA